MEKSLIKLRGVIHWLHRNAEGRIIDEGQVSNTITNAGLGVVSGLLGATGGYTAFKWLAIGDSGTAHAATDTLLNSELVTADSTGMERAAATVSQVTTAQANDTLRLVKTFTNNSSNLVSVKEAGVFNTSTENTATMLAAGVITTQNLSQGSTLKITYDIQVS